MNINEHIARSAKSVYAALDKILPGESDEPAVIHRAIRYSVLSGGKRIRPLILLEAARACSASWSGAGGSSRAMAAACAVEMVHAYSLIHDDLPAMDNDSYRRGRPSCHKAFGEANAILAGDALLTMAFNLLAHDDDCERGIKAVKTLSDAIGTEGMVGGQVMDMEGKGKKKSGERIYFINMRKTAKLFEASARLGAIMARGTSRQEASLAKFGLSFGMGFQITDDLIDNDGYARLVGAEKARLDCEALTLEAKAALDMFGKKGGRLKSITDYVMTRRR